MITTTIQGAIEKAESLGIQDQKIFIKLFQKRFSERRRNEIAINGKITLNAIKQKKAKIGSVNDFLNDIEE
jgi:hypothetical protein